MNLRLFVRWSIVFTLCVIVLGAYTRLTDAGLGCPDWPGCYGKLLVPASAEEVDHKPYLEERPLDVAKGWAEMVHRYFAGTLGLLILAVMAWSWRLRGRNPDQPVWLPTLLLGVVVFQAVLGMWTVTWQLKPVVVMGHLLGGFTTLSLLYLLSLRLQPAPVVWRAHGLRLWGGLGLLILIMQIALGGWTSTNYAALQCTDFPSCQGSYWPNMDFDEAFVMWRGLGVNYEFGVLDNPARTAIHFSHRIGALITFVYLALFSFALWRRKALLARAGLIVAGLLLLQVVLGISNVVFHLPLWVAVAHNAVAALLLLSMVKANYLLWQRQP